MQNRGNPTTYWYQPREYGNFVSQQPQGAATAAAGIPIRPPRDIHVPVQMHPTPIEPLLMNHQLMYSNIGPNPGPCSVCMMQRQPQNIYLRHCIPCCPAVVLPYRVYFATSDLIAPNDIRPHAVYQLGVNYYSRVPGGYHLVQPVVVGFFNPPPLPATNPAVVASISASGSTSNSSQTSITSCQTRRISRQTQHRTRANNLSRFRNNHPKPGTSFSNKNQ